METVSISLAQGAWLRLNYPIPGPLKVSFWRSGVNLTYFVDRPKERFVLRIYTPGWRTPPQIRFELAQLEFLHRAGVAVARPLQTRKGNLTANLWLPDGRTSAACFTYAAPDLLERKTVRIAKDQGLALAKLHNAQDHFSIRSKLPAFDVDGLVERPMRMLIPYRRSFGRNWGLLTKIDRKIKKEISALPKSSPHYGLIHGDTHAANMNFDPQTGQFVLFDFDLSADGWRLFDLATAMWDHCVDNTQAARTKRIFNALIKGYTAARPLSVQEIRVFPAMLAARHLWLLGFHAESAERWGTELVGEKAHAWKMKFLKRWYQGEIQEALFGKADRKRPRSKKKN